MKRVRFLVILAAAMWASGCGKVNLKCSPGQTSCAGGCADVTSDSHNCGACGVSCSADQQCVAGACACTVAGLTGCGTTCTDLTSDAANCGACGNACPSGQACTNGACACGAGMTDCGGGSCIDLQTDAANCGACGNACAAGTACTAGKCGCGTGLSACGGACVDEQTDNGNCGGCGTVCGTGKSCQAGQCVCSPGDAICGGACVDEQTDNSNCGACGVVCGTGKSCQAGTCKCTGGKTDCSGVCVDEQTDNSNCGACGTTCTGGKSCQTGMCKCTGGQVDCGGTCFTVSADRAHCGPSCQVCTATQVCNNGCVTAPAASFTSTWGDPTGWLDSAGQPIQASLAPTSIPGVVYQCRTGPAATIGTQAFGNCDGSTGVTAVAKPTAGANGSFQIDYHYTQGSYTSNTASFPFYVHSSLNSVPKCTQKFTDAQYFAAAQAYATANPTKFSIPATPLFTGDANLKLRNPFIVIPFKQVHESIPMGFGGWPATQPFDFTTKDLSLRHKFVLSSDNKLLMLKRNFQSSGGGCINMSEHHGHGWRSPIRSCDAFIVNINGQALCISAAGTSPAVVPNTDSGGAFVSGWNVIRTAPYAAPNSGIHSTNLCGAASCQSNPALIFLPP